MQQGSWKGERLKIAVPDERLSRVGLLGVENGVMNLDEEEIDLED